MRVGGAGAAFIVGTSGHCAENVQSLKSRGNARYAEIDYAAQLPALQTCLGRIGFSRILGHLS